MGDDQIATHLGQISGKLDAMQTFLRDYIEAHDSRHTKIEAKIDAHSDDLSQARGAKGALLFAAGLVSGVVSFLSKKLF